MTEKLGNSLHSLTVDNIIRSNLSCINPTQFITVVGQTRHEDTIVNMVYLDEPSRVPVGTFAPLPSPVSIDPSCQYVHHKEFVSALHLKTSNHQPQLQFKPRVSHDGDLVCRIRSTALCQRTERLPFWRR